jgi:hypothetical protein
VEHIRAFASFLLVLDFAINGLCVIAYSGLVGPSIESSDAKLMTVVTTVRNARERAVIEKIEAALKLSAGNRSNEAAVIASMMGNKDSEVIFENALSRFRAVDWDVLKENLDVFRGGTLDGKQAEADLLALSEPCEIGECDAFLSHSWHDDVELKIAELTKWCEEFRAKTRVAPTLWVDKLCINQLDIASDLECLPVFLAGCNNMLVLSGETYTSRLWCIVELFVYVNMQTGGSGAQAGVQVIPLGADLTRKKDIWNTWSRFNCLTCNCFRQEDKDHIMKIIQEFPGGVECFNSAVVKLSKDVKDGYQTLNESAGLRKSWETSNQETENEIGRISEKYMTSGAGHKDSIGSFR